MRVLMLAAFLLSTLSLATAWAQSETAAPAASENAPAADEPVNAEDVMSELLRQRQAPPQVAPTKAPAKKDVPGRVGMPATQVDIDPAVLGVAPGQEPPKLRREGSFIVSRHGRLRRSQDGVHLLFVLDADDKASPELPLVMQPCKMLESMETIVDQRGEQVQFILSGQVHTYRGANYLLPTMMQVAHQKGNLQ